MRTGNTHLYAGHSAMSRSGTSTPATTPTGAAAAAAAVASGFGGGGATSSAASPRHNHYQPPPRLGPTDTLFQLECVLLFALDVVKGPYIHSCAPASPSDAIRSFFLAPASTPVATSSASASASAEDGVYKSLSSIAAAMGTLTASTPIGASRRSGQLPPPPISPQQPTAGTTAAAVRVQAVSRPALEAQSGGEVASAATPLSCGTWFLDSAAASASAAVRVADAPSNSSPFFAPAPSGSFGATGLPSGSAPLSSFPTPPLSSTSLAHPAGGSASGSAVVPPTPVAGTPAVSYAQTVSAVTSEPSPPLHAVSASAESFTARSPLPPPFARSCGGGDSASAASSLAAQRRLLDHANAFDMRSEVRPDSSPGSNAAVAAAAAAPGVEGPLFGVSALTSMSDSQQGASPLFESFAAAPYSPSGDGFPVEVSASESSMQGRGGTDTASSRSAFVGARGGGSRVLGDAEALLTEPGRSAGASLVLTPMNMPSTEAAPPQSSASAATAAASASRVDVEETSNAAARGLQQASSDGRQQPTSPTQRQPSSTGLAPSSRSPPQVATPYAVTSPPPPQFSHGPPPSTTSADDGRMSGYNDVFVPRPEFCRRVLWLYPAESGLLFLYYPEDIPGEHYQRKTLRYSLCLVFCVDQRRMTIGDGLLHQLVRPYSVVLTNIAEELREAELKYAYMSRGLRSLSSSVNLVTTTVRTVPSLALTSSVSASAAGGEARQESASGLADRGDGGVPGDDTEAAASAGASGQGTVPKPYTLVRRRGGNGQTVVTSSASSTLRPDAYHLNLFEPGSSTTVSGGWGFRNPAVASMLSTAETTPTSFMSPLQPPTTAPSASASSRPVEQVAAAGDGGDGQATRSTTKTDSRGAPAAAEDAREGSSDPPTTAARWTTSNVAGQASATTAGTASATATAVPAAPSESTLHTTSKTTSVSTTTHTPASPPPMMRSHSDSRGGAAVFGELPQSSTSGISATSGGGGGAGVAAGFTAFDSSNFSTDAESPETATTPPSSLLLRSRTTSHGAGLSFHAPSSSLGFLPTLGESSSTLASSSAAPSALTPMTGPPNTTYSNTASGRPPRHAGAPSSTSPRSTAVTHRSPVRTSAGAVTSSCGGGGGVVTGMHTLNAFITPPTAPQWTPLSELVEKLFQCLQYTGDVADAADRDGERETYSASGGMGGLGAAGQRTPVTPSPTSVRTGSTDAGVWHSLERPHGAVAAGVGRPAVAHRTPRTFAGSPQQLQHASVQSIYSPLTTTIGSGIGGGGGGGTSSARTPSWMADSDASLALFDGGRARDGCGAGPSYPPGAVLGQPLRPTQQQQQRGDTSIVHLSNRLSFHVRRMAPLQPARLLHFDHVPVPVVAYDPAMMGWMDMAVHHVFRLVDGVRTVADLVFDVAMGTTTTLPEVYAEALQRTLVAEGSPRGPAMPSAPNTVVRGGGGVGSPSSLASTIRDAPMRRTGAAVPPASESVLLVRGSEAAAGSAGPAPPRGSPATAAAYPSYPVVVSVAIDARPSPALLPGVRYSVPTSAAAAAAAAAISEGQAPPPSHVNVRVTPSTPPPAPPTVGASAAAASAPAQPHISVELPPTWVRTTGMVMEALLHLELCHLIKVYRPWTKSTVYSTTRAVQWVLRSAQHPARRVVAHYLLCMAWAERQEVRAERRRRATEWKRAQREARREAAASAATAAAAAAAAVSVPPGLSATPKLEASQLSPFSRAPSPSPPGRVNAETRTPVTTAAVPTTASVSSGLSAAAGAAGPEAVERLPSNATAPLPASPQARSLTRAAGLLSPSLSRPPQPPMCVPSPSFSGAGDRGGAAGAASCGVELSSAGTHASSSATSFAPSSLRHALSVGASGRLQMTLTSSLLTSPLLRPGASATAPTAMPASAAGRGSSQRLSVGSQGSQMGVGDLLPCASTGITYTARSTVSKHHHAAREQQQAETSDSQRASRPRRSHVRSSNARTESARSCSCSSTTTSDRSSSSSSGTASGARVRRRSKSPASSLSSDAFPASSASLRRRHRSGSSSSTSSGSSVASSPSTPSMASSPTLAATAQQQQQQLKSASVRQAGGGASSGRASKRAAASTVGEKITAVMPQALGVSHQDDASAKKTASLSSALPTASAAAAGGGGLQHCSARHRRQQPLKVFAPSEQDIAQAAAAALCALAKFSNSSVSCVQAEMRRIPVWASSFNHWSDRCVNALVEVAVLNNWLEDVSL